MPYCSKCGAKLDEDAKFCPKCGTSVVSPRAKPERRRKERKPISILAIFLITLIVIAAVITAIAAISFFLPVRTVHDSESRHVPYQAGVNTLNLDLTADVAGVNITFEDLTGKLVTLNMSAYAKAGVFASPDLFDLTFDNTTVGSVLTVTVDIDAADIVFRNITCDIRIDPSMNASLNVMTSTGGIVLNTQVGVVLDSLSLEATTGGVEANLVEDGIVAGDVSFKTTTGGVKLFWDNVVVTKDVQVDAITTTGGVDVNVKEDERLQGDITLKAEATTGGVDFAIDIKGDVGAIIVSSVTTGGIDVDRRVGFSGPDSALQSSNYLAGHNFDVNLKTTTGRIEIDAKHTP